MSYPREIRIEDPLEALIVEQALAMARDLKQVANDSPDGQVLSRAEQCAVRQGREFVRKSLEAVLNAQSNEVEKKVRQDASAHAGATAPIAGDAVEPC